MPVQEVWLKRIGIRGEMVEGVSTDKSRMFLTVRRYRVSATNNFKENFGE